MSSTEQIRALEELAGLDGDVKALEEKLAEERGILLGLTENLKKLDERLQADRSALASSDKQRSEIHSDVRTMTQQIEHSRDKLGRSRNERESQAAQRELEELRKLIRDREGDLQRLETDGAPLRARIEMLESERATVAGELASREADVQAKVAQMEADRDSRGGGRELVAKKLPPALFRKYELIRGRRGSAVAKTTDGTCNKCNIALPPQLYHRLRREPIIDQCPACNRLIYFAAPEQATKVD